MSDAAEAIDEAKARELVGIRVQLARLGTVKTKYTTHGWAAWIDVQPYRGSVVVLSNKNWSTDEEDAVRDLWQAARPILAERAARLAHESAARRAQETAR